MREPLQTLKYSAWTILCAMLSICSVWSQNKLAQSADYSSDIYIYRLEEPQKYIKANNKELLPEDLPLTYVCQSLPNDTLPWLTRGNYMLAFSKQGKVYYQYYCSDTIAITVIPGPDLQLRIYGLNGKVIDNATVRLGKKNCKFNYETQLYNCGHSKKNALLSVKFNDVYHFFNYSSSAVKPIRNYYGERTHHKPVPANKKNKQQIEGFMVFSKPKYRPNDRIQLKIYATTQDQKLYNKPISLRLKHAYWNYGKESIDTLLIKDLMPYRPGMYCYEFKVTDSLKLRLDQNYKIIVVTEDNKEENLSGSFKYEDYELKGIQLSFTSLQEEYEVGDSIPLKVSVIDINGLPYYGGRCELKLFCYGVQNMVPNSMIHISNLLWSDKFDMSDNNKLEITLPDSAYNHNVSANYNLLCTYWGADQEQHTASISFTINRKIEKLELKQENNTLIANLLNADCQKPAAAILTLKNQNGQCISRKNITLPYKESIPWYVYTATVSTENGLEEILFIQETQCMVNCNLSRKKDSVILEIDNPYNIPFNYSIVENKREKENGYATSLKKQWKQKGKSAYAVRISYNYGKSKASYERTLPYIDKDIVLSVETERKVYPGQQTELIVTATNSQGEPLENLDIAAYGYTAKFNTPHSVHFDYTKNTAVFEPLFTSYNLDEKEKQQTEKNRYQWLQQMGLDSALFYQFCYTPNYFQYNTPTTDGTTQIIPYIVSQGTIMSIGYLYIDHTLYYVNYSNNMPYIFQVEPGTHTLSLRIYGKRIEAENVPIQKGHKNFIAISADQENYQVAQGQDTIHVKCLETTKQERYNFSDNENLLINKCMIEINSLGYYQLPNMQEHIPGMNFIETNDQVYPYLTYTHYSSRYYNSELVGPFPHATIVRDLGRVGAVYFDSTLMHYISLRGNEKYTLTNSNVTINPLSFYEFNADNKESYNFKADILRKEQLLKLQKDYIQRLFCKYSDQIEQQKRDSKEKWNTNLNLTLDIEEPIAMILFKRHEQPDDYILFYGNNRHFNNLPYGNVDMHIFINDSTSYVATLDLKPDGKNYYRMGKIKPVHNDSICREMFNKWVYGLKPHYYTNPFSTDNEALNKRFHIGGTTDKHSGIIISEDDYPIEEASIKIKGDSTVFYSNSDGEYIIEAKLGDTLIVEAFSYKTKEVAYRPHQYQFITLTSEDDEFEDVEETDLYASYRSEPMYSRNVQIRGIGSIKSSSTNAFDSEVASIGAIQEEAIDMSKNGYQETITTYIPTEISADMSSGVMRHNFNDVAFWQPRLTTDAQGQTKAQVTYPDDLTQWSINIIGFGEKPSQRAEINLNIHSILPLSAELSMPRFALRQDSFTAIGKITNYTENSVSLSQQVVTENDSLNSSYTLERIHVEPIAVTATQGDSLSVSFNLSCENGYYDGERRTIPIFEQGIEETVGTFKVLNNSVNFILPVDTLLGTIEIFADNNSREILLTEVEHIARYPYQCNEQIASKLKALLAKKQIYEAIKRPFKEDKLIKTYITQLEKNSNDEGLWGWWGKSSTSPWISYHVVDAMLLAQEKGYSVKLNRSSIQNYMIQQLNEAIAWPKGKDKYTHRSKQELLQALELLHRLKAAIDYADYLQAIDQLLADNKLTDKLQLAYTAQALNLTSSFDKDSVLKYMHSTILGGYYWENDIKIMARLPYRNRVESTLLAYKTLKSYHVGNDTLNAIRNYFFENRANGHWGNTYQSSRIIETILPDLISVNNEAFNANLTINGKKIEQFPYREKLNGCSEIKVSKTGSLPLFFTTYQHYWDATPSRDWSDKLRISSSINGDTNKTTILKAGENSYIEAIIECKEEANYVQIEIPIPAGCSYDEKFKSSFRETHREYYKDRVVIFCNYLPAGEHKFKIKILPRFNGNYHLNPTSFELMYYPTFECHEGMKEVQIKEL